MTDAELLDVLVIQQLGWASYIHRIETLHPLQMTAKESLEMLTLLLRQASSYHIIKNTSCAWGMHVHMCAHTDNLWLANLGRLPSPADLLWEGP